MASLNLRKFDMSKIGRGSVVVMIGKRNTGKSFLTKDLLYYKRDIPIGTVISGTEGANQFYSKIVPPLFIHEEFSPEIIANTVRRQKLVVKKMQQQEQMYNGNSNIDPYAFVILDDCLYDASWTKDTNMRSLFMNGRHYKVLLIITSQYSLGIPPNLRCNIDYVFILRENYISNRKRLYEHYAGMFPTFEVFCQVMDQCTENYECLVIDNTSKSNKIEDMVFWYKADNHPEFTMGAPDFWQHHSNNFNDFGEEDQDEDFDPNCVKKKKGPTINVKKRY
tara:strand:- start:207 stop:1040 length:834 start_codon:yes stop_codon:yes gene_type:complete